MKRHASPEELEETVEEGRNITFEEHRSRVQGLERGVEGSRSDVRNTEKRVRMTLSALFF